MRGVEGGCEKGMVSLTATSLWSPVRRILRVATYTTGICGQVGHHTTGTLGVVWDLPALLSDYGGPWAAGVRVETLEWGTGYAGKLGEVMTIIVVRAPVVVVTWKA